MGGSSHNHADSRSWKERRVRITGIELFHVHVNEVRGNWTFVRVRTDEGILGLGEASSVHAPDRVEAAVRRLEPLVVGMDPFNIEGFLHECGRPEHFVTPNHITATSGIEQALWDIKGKALGVPVHELLGGALRDKVRLYANINRKEGLAPTPDGFAKAAVEAVENGFTAVKFFPFWGLMDGSAVSEGRLERRVIDQGLERVRAMRRAVGREVGILLQLPTYDMSFEQVLKLARELEEFNPFWYQTSFPRAEDTARLVESTKVPVTGGPRGRFRLGRSRWREVFEKGTANIINPDLMGAGGIWEMKKIASMAEAWDVDFSPHSPYGPVHTVADIHLCATIPNFLILEYSYGETPWRGGVVNPPEEIQEGHAVVPQRPGLGLELDQGEVVKHPLGPHPEPGRLDPVWGILPARRSRRGRRG